MLQQGLAGSGPAEGHHRSLVVDLRFRREPERCQRPHTRRDLQVAPDREADAPPGSEDPVDLAYRVGRGPPDATEAGDHVERAVAPGQIVHVSDADVAFGIAEPGDVDKAHGCIDPGAPRPAKARELDRQPRAAGHVEQPVAGVDPKEVVERHILAAVRRLAQRREVHRPAPPALVD